MDDKHCQWLLDGGYNRGLRCGARAKVRYGDWVLCGAHHSRAVTAGRLCSCKKDPVLLGEHDRRKVDGVCACCGKMAAPDPNERKVRCNFCGSDVRRDEAERYGKGWLCRACCACADQMSKV